MKVGIIGAGKIGVPIAALLERAEFCTEIRLADLRIMDELGASAKTSPHRLDVSSPDELARFVQNCDAVTSAAPFYLKKVIAKASACAGRSYFDLTEDVETTNFVRRRAEGQAATFMPQGGPAPGAINVIGSGLANSFKTVRTLEMRVGALPLSAIQLATAAGLAAVLELFARGCLPSGFVRQEAIGLEAFLNTQWGGRVYGQAETIAPEFCR
jgi:saccharopine dehydrogenase-like NADP-dependent oxidoreductase